MKKRSPWAVLLLPFITLGIYSWYWEVKTKGEMNQKGEHIPTAWIWLIPFVGYLWWAWKYSEGVGHVTQDKAPGILVFLLMIFTGSIGDAIIQYYFNEMPGTASAAPATPSPAPAATEAAAPVVETPAPEEPANEPPVAPPVTDTPPTQEETPEPPATPLVQ